MFADGTVRSAVPAESNEPFSGVAVRAPRGALQAGHERTASRSRRASGSSLPFTRPPSAGRAGPETPPTLRHARDRAFAPARHDGAIAPARGRSRRCSSAALTRSRRAPSRSRAPRSGRFPGAFGDPVPRHRDHARRHADRLGIPLLLHPRRSTRRRRLLPRRRPRPLSLPRRRRAVGHPSCARRSRRSLPGRLSGAVRTLRRGHRRPERRSPPPTELHGEYNVRPFDAGALVESPFDGGRGTRPARRPLLVSRACSSPLIVPGHDALVLGLPGARDVRLHAARPARASSCSARTTTSARRRPGTTQTLFGDAVPPRRTCATNTALERRRDAAHRRSPSAKTSPTQATVVPSRSPHRRAHRAHVRQVVGALCVRASTRRPTHYDVVYRDRHARAAATAALAANFFPSRTDLAAGVRADACCRLRRGLEVTPGRPPRLLRLAGLDGPRRRSAPRRARSR